jgi:hypothetical protein
MGVAATLVRSGQRAARCENTDSGAPRPTLELRQIAGSACVLHLPAGCSVWPRTNDLGALDLSARSGADRVHDAVADRQIGAAVSLTAW